MPSRSTDLRVERGSGSSILDLLKLAMAVKNTRTFEFFRLKQRSSFSNLEPHCEFDKLRYKGKGCSWVIFERGLHVKFNQNVYLSFLTCALKVVCRILRELVCVLELSVKRLPSLVSHPRCACLGQEIVGIG